MRKGEMFIRTIEQILIREGNDAYHSRIVSTIELLTDDEFDKLIAGLIKT